MAFHGHACGGLTIGFAGTDYDTYLDLLENQKISFAKYDSDYVASYKANKTPFGPCWPTLRSSLA